MPVDECEPEHVITRSAELRSERAGQPRRHHPSQSDRGAPGRVEREPLSLRIRRFLDHTEGDSGSDRRIQIVRLEIHQLGHSIRRHHEIRAKPLRRTTTVVRRSAGLAASGGRGRK